jgi:hypothetical protein
MCFFYSCVVGVPKMPLKVSRNFKKKRKRKTLSIFYFLSEGTVLLNVSTNMFNFTYGAVRGAKAKKIYFSLKRSFTNGI